MSRSPRRTSTEELKLQMIELHKNGKRRSDIIREYKLTAFSLYNWIKQYAETKSFTPMVTSVNNAENSNYLRQDFAVGLPHLTIVSDLTYVKVNNTWNYICLMIDLYNGEIVGPSCRKHKDSTIVKQAFSSTSFSLYDIENFHTDRGSELKNAAIDETLRTFQIQHSLSKKGCLSTQLLQLI